VLSEAAMGLAIDGAVQHEGRGDRVPSQRCEKRQGFPVAMRDLGEERLSAAAPAARAGHVGFGPDLINENKAIRAWCFFQRSRRCSVRLSLS
jgi:hypothetical protein